MKIDDHGFIICVLFFFFWVLFLLFFYCIFFLVELVELCRQFVCG